MSTSLHGLSDFHGNIAERVFGADAQHIQSEGMRTESHNNVIERFHGTIKQGTEVMRALERREAVKPFMDGRLIYYNYLRQHEGLKGKTPPQVAGVEVPFKSWRELIGDGYHKSAIRASN